MIFFPIKRMILVHLLIQMDYTNMILNSILLDLIKIKIQIILVQTSK